MNMGRESESPREGRFARLLNFNRRELADRARRLVAAISENRSRITVVIIFLLFAVWGIVLDHYELVIGYSPLLLLLTTACTGVAPELAGIVIGVVTIDYLNERRQDDQLKQQLILQLGSAHEDVTDSAIRVLMARGWLNDGTLEGSMLWQANLKWAVLTGADLRRSELGRANLMGAILARANLQAANMYKANLESANLQGACLLGAQLEEVNLGAANLQDADLSGAVLQWAELGEADLQHAILQGADLDGASLRDANLRGAVGYTIEQLSKATTLEGATMPDGVRLLRYYHEEGIGADDEYGLIVGQRDGPTFEEWVAMQTEAVDHMAVEEARALVAGADEEE